MKAEACQVIPVLIGGKYLHVIKVLAVIIIPASLKTQTHSVGKAVHQHEAAGKEKGILGIGFTIGAGFRFFTEIIPAPVFHRKPEEANALAGLQVKSAVTE